jgi:hypothetical protein
VGWERITARPSCLLCVVRSWCDASPSIASRHSLVRVEGESQVERTLRPLVPGYKDATHVEWSYGDVDVYVPDHVRAPIAFGVGFLVVSGVG